MGKTPYINIKKISIKNIKNVESGTIEAKNKNKVIGVYGQNGSGKTALVESFLIIRDMIKGKKIKDNVIELMNDDKEAQITIVFEDSLNREITYEFKLRKKTPNNLVDSLNLNLNPSESKKITVELYEERLEATILVNERKKRLSIHYCIDEVSPTLSKELYKRNKVNQAKLEYIKTNSIEAKKSLIFSTLMDKFINENDESFERDQFLQCINIVKDDFAENLFIHSNNLSGMIYTGYYIPIIFSVKVDKNNTVSGIIPIPADETANFSELQFKVASIIFDQINGVLPKIIPGLEIKINILEKSQNKDLEKFVSFELISKRGDSEIPFKSESDGVKKIVSILSTLINAYNTPNVFAIIDELDSGIYEYLLGELLEAFAEGAQGTLIFTSHNLRPLEVLGPDRIMFSTTNPKNRYIYLDGIKSSNNFRSKYLRAVQVGGYSEELYDQTDKFEIQNSMIRTHRKMTKVLKENLT